MQICKMIKMDSAVRQRAIRHAWPQLVDFLGHHPEWVLRKAKELLHQRDLSRVEGVADPKAKVSLVLDLFLASADASPPIFQEFIQSVCMEFNLPMELEITFMSVSGEGNVTQEQDCEEAAAFSPSISARPERRRPWSSPSTRSNCKASKQQRLDSAERYRHLVVQLMLQRYGANGSVETTPLKDQPSAFSQAFVNLVIRQRKAWRLKGRMEKAKEEHVGLHDVEEHSGATMTLSDLLETVQMDTTKVIFLLGNPGMGKTRLMHRICQQWAEGALPQFRLVFLFEFRQLNLIKRKLTLQELLFEFFLQPESCPDAAFEQLQEDAQHTLVIFDGLDEFLENIQLPFSLHASSPDLLNPLSTAELFANLCYGKLLPGCTVLVTTRPKTIPEAFLKTSTLSAEICGFNREKVEEYASYYFRHHPKKEQALAHLKSNGKLLSMCCIPALCNIVCICLEHMLLQNAGSTQLPQTMTGLYIQMLCTFICKHQTRSALTEEVDLGRHRATLLGLCEWAFEALEQKKMLFYAGEVPEQVKDFGCQHRLLLSFEVKTSNGQAQVGYTFVHFSLQEFFAALFQLASRSIDGNSLKQMFFLRSKWTLKKEARMPFTANCHVFQSGLASKECRGFLSSLAGESETWVQERQAIVMQVLKKLAESHLTGPRIAELCHCMYEAQDLQLAQHLGKQLDFDFQFRNLRLTPLDMMALAFVITSGPHLVCLTFVGCSMELDYLDVFGNCENIKSLSFRSRKYGNEFATVLSQILPKIKHLTTFHLTGGNLAMPGLERLIAAFANCQQLEDINLQDNKLKEQELVKATEAFSTVNNLKQMDLSFNEVSADAILTFTGAAVLCPKVTELHIRKDSLKIYFASRSKMDPRLKGVEIKEEETVPKARSLILRLQDCQFGSQRAKDLADLFQSCSPFSEIDLSDNQLGDEGCSQLMQSVPKLCISGPLSLNNNRLTLKSIFCLLNTVALCPNIVKLNVSINHQTATLTFVNEGILDSLHSSNYSSDEDQSSCDGQQVTATPREICLTDNKLCDEGDVNKLCLALRRCGGVSELNLSNNSLGDLGVLKVAQLLPKMKALRSLTLDGNRLSLEGAFRLVESFSSLKHMTSMQLSLRSSQTVRLTFGEKISCREHEGELLQPAEYGRCFSLTDCDVGPDDIDRLFRILVTCSSLTEINLSGNVLQDREIEQLLAFLPHLKNLKLLRIGENSFSPQSLCLLVSSLYLCKRTCDVEVRSKKNAFLRFMEIPESQEASCRLTDCGIGQDGLKELCVVFKKCNRLAELDLSGNHLGNKGLQFLLEHLPETQVSCLLKISHNQISHDGVLHLISIFTASQNVAEVHASLHSAEMLLITLARDAKPSKILRLKQCNFQAEHLAQLSAELGKCVSLNDFTSTNNGLVLNNAEGLFRSLRTPNGTLRISIEEPWVKGESISALLTLATEAQGNITAIKKDGTLFAVEQEFLHRVEKVESVVSSFHRCELDAKETRFSPTFIEKCKQLRALHCSQVEITDVDGETILDFLLHFPALKRLELTCCRISPAGMECLASALRQCRTMEDINFSKSELGTDGISMLLGSLEGKHQLRSINLGFLNLDNTHLPKLISGLSAMPLLRRLSLNNNQLSGNACPHLARALENAINLEEIDLSYNKIDGAGVKEIAAALPEMENTKQINLSGNKIGNESLEKLAPVLRSLHHLKVLRLSSCNIDSEGMVHLAKALFRCPQIEEISLSENSIGDKGVMVLMEQLPQHSQLRKINLKVCGISNGAFKTLAFGLSRCPLLEEIILSWNNLGDESAAGLAEILPRMAKLQILDLDNNHITAYGAEKLAEALLYCRGIQSVRLWHNWIPKDAEQKLREREPRLVFNFV
ncbi:protein NLRC5 [Sceloporus undulatus]|uniref:protein NLRC5 n=1 Tax=Sceloporus undulatus TaxID=8520 RepID=UPI001C4D5C01|nr:protein NLRC5 [Sceloporus undulatus]